MKEFDYTFDKGLVIGLRPREDNPRNSQALTDAFNVRASKDGLIAYIPVIDPTSSTVSKWPFPRLYIGKSVNILADNSNIYEVSSGWAKTEVLDLGTTVTTPWAIADFHDYVVMASDVLIDRNPTTGLWSVVEPSSTMPLFKTCCNFKGQLIGGNVNSDWYDCGVGHVIWARPGSTNFLSDKRNAAGYMPMPFGGEVYRTLPLGDSVVVYGSSGLAVLSPISSPAPGFGVAVSYDFGIASVGAVAGDDSVHVFVDEGGQVWAIGADGKVTLLDYKEFMDELTAEDIVVSHDPQQKKFFISDGTKTFLLATIEATTDLGVVTKSYGMTEVYQHPTNVQFSNSGLLGIYNASSDAEFRIATDILDFGLRAQKTTQTIELGISASDDCYVAVDWRTDKSASWNTVGWNFVNPQGIATVICAGTEFRLKVKCDDYSDVNLDYMTIRFKLTDKRSIRGKYNVG